MSEALRKILIIDDDPYILDMYAIKFQEAGFQVEKGSNGKDALDKVSSYQPELALLDVIMPVYDGFEVLKRMKDEGMLPHTKVVILSNLGQKEDVDRGLALGAIDYIIKGHFTPSEVVEKVKKVLNK